ncbi:hypothetical protein J2W34_003828 [Variovorax boronicumulans]|nr:hypothetical protein [Variovorax boronicumulans]
MTNIAVPSGVSTPAPTVAVWSVPAQLIAWVVTLVHAADAEKEAAASAAAASSGTPRAADVDLACPRPNSEATVQSASALFQMTRNIVFMSCNDN